MGSKLLSNAIIRGYVNSYCLVCECYFNMDDETIDHIQETTHSDKLSAHPYLEKYGDNHIRKVNKGYFCEFCGLLLATGSKMSLHVQEKSHYERKGLFLLRRPRGASSVTAFDDLLIDEKAWHSFSEDMCALCDEEISDENIHKTKSEHLLKLVQTKVEFAPNNNLYRKIDNSSYQCLTCNAVFLLDTIDEHFTGFEHKNLYCKCQEEYKKYVEQQANISEPIKTGLKQTTEVKQTIKTEVKQEQDNNRYTLPQNTAIPNKCDMTLEKKVTSQKNDIEQVKAGLDKNHNKVEVTEFVRNCGQTKEPTKEKESAKEKEPIKVKEVVKDEMTVFADKHCLTYNTGNSNTFCRLCEIRIPASLRNMKEHVAGKAHNNRLERVKQLEKAANMKPRITKKLMSKMKLSCMLLETALQEYMIVNEQYCMPAASFFMVTPLGDRYRCQVCEENMQLESIEEHAQTARHERAMDNTPVITSLPDTEFVREVRPNIYHCAFCNMVLPRWDDVQSHLLSREHRENKDGCRWRLHRHLPELTERRRREVNAWLALMFHRGGF